MKTHLMKTTTQLTTFVVAAMFLFGGSFLAYAESAPWWEFSYEADLFPWDESNFPRWTYATDRRFSPPMKDKLNDGDGIWIQDTGMSEKFALAWKLSEASQWKYAVDVPVTVEVRLKVNSAGSAGPDVAVGTIRMAPLDSTLHNRTFYFYFGENWVALGGSNLGGLRKFHLDTTQFHTYRIVIIPDTNNVTAELYLDNNPAPVIMVASGSGNPGKSKFLWGDTRYSETGSIGGGFSLDYLRWVNNKAVYPEADD